MVIKKDPNLIFIHIPKCAGVSIERFFGWNGLRHETLRKYSSDLSYNELEKFFKFTFIRNPWDRMVSWYFHHHGDPYEPKNKQGFDHWVRKGLPNHWENKTVDGEKWSTQDPLSILGFLLNKENISLNYVGRLETINEDMEYICEKNNIEYSQPIKKINSSNRGNYKEYYNSETIKIIEKRFEQDLNLFPYDF